MTETRSLFELSERHNHLYLQPLKDSQIVSIAVLLPSGTAAWTVNPDGMSTKVYRDNVSHELGHAETGSFYTRLSAPTSREKCEETARRWQYENMIRYDELMDAFARGITTTWELSELFEMPEDFVRRAVEYYKMKEDTERSGGFINDTCKNDEDSVRERPGQEEADD